MNMARLLNTGDHFEEKETGITGRIIEFIDKGGQGEVYSARLATGEKIAVKVYLVEYLKQFPNTLDNIQKLINVGKPSETFIWPRSVLSVRDKKNVCGYSMSLLGENSKSFESFRYSDPEPCISLKLKVAKNIASAMETLHSKGMYYVDLNEKNVHVNQSTGDVEIFDNDNVGTGLVSSTNRIGFTGFVSPEVLGGGFPDQMNDLHAMGVLFYQLFYSSHPMWGEKFIKEVEDMGSDEERMFYKDAPFHFDPNDKSNRALSVEQHARIEQKAIEDVDEYGGAYAFAYREFYPDSFNDLFMEMFSEGLLEGWRRPVGSRWLNLFEKMEHRIVECGCGFENIRLDIKRQKCFECEKILSFEMPALELNQDIHDVLLRDGLSLSVNKLSGEILGLSSILNDTELDHKAKVVKHPKKDFLGLMNVGTEKWIAKRPDTGEVKNIEPGGAPLTLNHDGIQIDFCEKIKGRVKFVRS